MAHKYWWFHMMTALLLDAMAFCASRFQQSSRPCWLPSPWPSALQTCFHWPFRVWSNKGWNMSNRISWTLLEISSQETSANHVLHLTNMFMAVVMQLLGLACWVILTVHCTSTSTISPCVSPVVLSLWSMKPWAPMNFSSTKRYLSIFFSYDFTRCAAMIGRSKSVRQQHSEWILKQTRLLMNNVQPTFHHSEWTYDGSKTIVAAPHGTSHHR